VSEVVGRRPGTQAPYAMLVKSPSPPQCGFIYVDTLDEFPTKDRPELWNSFQHIIWECPNTWLFMTGRPHIPYEVEKYFPGYPDLTPIKPIQHDIGGYLAMRLKKDPQSDTLDPELDADILRIILDKISGAYVTCIICESHRASQLTIGPRLRIVSLIIDTVLEDAMIHQRGQSFHRMTNGLGLDHAYSKTLSHIGERRGNKVKLGIEALMWVSHAGQIAKGRGAMPGHCGRSSGYTPPSPQCALDTNLVELHFRTCYG